MKKYGTESQNFYLGLPDFGLFRALVEAVPWEAVLRSKGCRKAGHSPRTTSERHRNGPAQCAIRQASREENWPGMNRELLIELKGKKKNYQLWKKGQVTEEDYKSVIRLCREKVRKAKGPARI